MYISNLSHLLPVYTGSKSKTLLWWYALIGLLFDISLFVLKHTGHNIGWQSNVFVLIEFGIISAYYMQLFQNKKIVYLVCMLLAAFFITHTLYIRPYDAAIPYSRFRFNIPAATVLYLWYIILTIFGFYKLITGPLIDNILKSSLFWVNVAFLIYASGVFFMFMFAETIRKQDIALGALLWSTVFCGLNIVKNILLAKALSIKNGPVEP